MNILELLTGTVIRNFQSGDVVPRELEAGFDLLGKLDHEWVWVVETAGEISGVLVASPCHGAVIVHRLALREGTPLGQLTGLLRKFIADIRYRGYLGYMTVIDPKRETAKKLKRVIERAGGKQIGGELILMAAPLPRENI